MKYKKDKILFYSKEDIKRIQEDEKMKKFILNNKIIAAQHKKAKE